MSGIMDLSRSQIQDLFLAALPHRAIDHAGLTEPAPSGAPAECLYDSAVVYRLDQGNDIILREIDVLQVRNDGSSDRVRDIFCHSVLCEDPVFSVDRLIECRHINTVDGGQFQKSLSAGESLLLAVCQGLQKVRESLLSVSDHEEVDEVRQRFRVECAGASGNDQWHGLIPVSSMQRKLRQLQHIKYIREGHLVLKGEPHYIHLRHGSLILKRKQRIIVAAHQLFHVGCRCKYPFTSKILFFIDYVIQDLQPHIGHADLIKIRKCKGEAHVHGLRVLPDHIDLVSGVACRLLHLLQDLIHGGTEQRIHGASHASFQFVHIVVHEFSGLVEACRPFFCFSGFVDQIIDPAVHSHILILAYQSVPQADQVRHSDLVKRAEMTEHMLFHGICHIRISVFPQDLRCDPSMVLLHTAHVMDQRRRPDQFQVKRRRQKRLVHCLADGVSRIADADAMPDHAGWRILLSEVLVASFFR